MSMNNLTIDGEFRYVVQWFNEWSELQRDDFIPLLVDYLKTSDSINESQTKTSSIETKIAPDSNDSVENDAKTSLNSNDKPMSLFQCRIKLFAQWQRLWPQDFKERLLQKIHEIDPKVHRKLNEEFQKSQSSSVNIGINNVPNCMIQTENCTGIASTTTTETLTNPDHLDDIELMENKRKLGNVNDGTPAVKHATSVNRNTAIDVKREIENDVLLNEDLANEFTPQLAHTALMKPVQITDTDDGALESLSTDAVENMNITQAEILQQQQEQNHPKPESNKLPVKVVVVEAPLVA